jgi:hypothetical protein
MVDRLKTSVTCLLVGLLLVLALSASSRGLHRLIHPDADSPAHVCLLTLFADGQVESATPTLALVALVALISASVSRREEPFLSAIAFHSPPGRAPPPVA